MSSPYHTLNRIDAVFAVPAGLPLREARAYDGLDAIQHEFRIYETETRLLYEFVDRVCQIIHTKSTSYKRDAEKIAEELNVLGDRIDTRIRELPRSQIYAVLDDSVSLTPEIMD
jgi:hypothetical protein